MDQAEIKRLSEIDGIRVIPANFQILQCKMFNTLYDLWSLSLERLKLDDTPSMEKEDALSKKEIEIVDHAYEYYERIATLRQMIWMGYEKVPSFKAAEDEACKDDYVRWMNYFVWTYDPRLSNYRYHDRKTGKLEPFPAKIPLIMYPSQVEVLEQINYCMRNRRPFVVEKSRAEGLTEIVTALCLHKWRYQEGFKGTFGSRQEREVDEIGNPDTIFARIRRMLYMLPPSMRPETFEKRGGANDKKLLINNSENGNTIVGEGGDNIGRGGRSTITIIDEKAYVEHPQAIDDAVGGNTDCQGDISTPNGMNHFYEKRIGGRTKVITVWWYKNPFKNKDWESGSKPSYSAWYDYQCKTHDDIYIAQNIDINYTASVEGVFIDSTWVQAAVDFDIDVPDADNISGFDVAAGGKNKSVYICRTGPRVHWPKVIPGDSPLEATWAAADAADADRAVLLNYDRNSIGEDVYPLLKKGERKINFRLNGIYGQDKASDKLIGDEGKRAYEKFRNKRAEIWWNLRERFRHTWEHVNGITSYPADQLISIPADNTLITQLSSPKLVHTSSGKIGVESKREMKGRSVSSPDHADALAYCFADYDGEGYVMPAFDYSDGGGQYVPFTVNFEKAYGYQYVALNQSDDMNVSLLTCMWYPHPQNPKLQVYGELILQDAQPKDVVEYVRSMTQCETKPIKEWIANEELFKGLDKGKVTPWSLYRREKIRLVRNYTDDHSGSIMIVNQLFENKMLQIHNSDCEKLMNQLRNCRKKRGRPDETMGLVNSLCQIVTRLKRKRELVVERLKKEFYKGGSRFRGGVPKRHMAYDEYLLWRKAKTQREKDFKYA